MFKFKSHEEGDQFVSILIKDGTDTQEVFNYIADKHRSINEHPHRMDNEEILLELTENCKYGFSLNALRSTVGEIAEAAVALLVVDTTEKSGRYISCTG